MGAIHIEISGQDAEGTASDLRAALLRSLDSTMVSELDIEKSVDPLVLMSVSFVGSQLATALWRWWDNRKPQTSRITIVFEDGERIELLETSQALLELRIEQLSLDTGETTSTEEREG